MIIYLDVETIPAGERPTIDVLKVPGTMSKAETIEKWWADTEAREADLDNIYRKRALSITECRVLCISFAIENEPVVGVMEDTEEKTMIAFRDALLAHDSAIFKRTVRLVAHNGRQFDFPILFLRSLKYKVEGLPSLFHVANPYESYVDTMTKFAFTAKSVMTSLKSACAFFGIQAKEDDIDGSLVYDYWLDGRGSEILKYCMSDVEAVRKLFLCLMYESITLE